MILRRTILKTITAALVLLTSAAVADEPNRKLAPDFTLRFSADTGARLSAYQGKVVLLNFWATWCTGCKQEIPWFIDFQTKYKGQGLDVLGVSLDDEGWKVLNPYLTEHPMNYMVGLGNDAIANLYGGVDALPTTVLIDRKGRIAYQHAGVVDRIECEKEIQSLLAEK